MQFLPVCRSIDGRHASVFVGKLSVVTSGGWWW